MAFFLIEVACFKPWPDFHYFKYSPPGIMQGWFLLNIQENITSSEVIHD